MSLDSSGDLAAMASPAAASRNEISLDWDIMMPAWKARVHDSLKRRITILSALLNKVTIRNRTTTVQMLFDICQVYQEPDRLKKHHQHDALDRPRDFEHGPAFGAIADGKPGKERAIGRRDPSRA